MLSYEEKWLEFNHGRHAKFYYRYIGSIFFYFLIIYFFSFFFFLFEDEHHIVTFLQFLNTQTQTCNLPWTQRVDRKNPHQTVSLLFAQQVKYKSSKEKHIDWSFHVFHISSYQFRNIFLKKAGLLKKIWIEIFFLANLETILQKINFRSVIH